MAPKAEDLDGSIVCIHLENSKRRVVIQTKCFLFLLPPIVTDIASSTHITTWLDHEVVFNKQMVSLIVCTGDTFHRIQRLADCRNQYSAKAYVA